MPARPRVKASDAGPIATFWSDINLIFTRFKYFFMEYFTHNAISGLTLIQPCGWRSSGSRCSPASCCFRLS